MNESLSLNELVMTSKLTSNSNMMLGLVLVGMENLQMVNEQMDNGLMEMERLKTEDEMVPKGQMVKELPTVLVMILVLVMKELM